LTEKDMFYRVGGMDRKIYPKIPLVCNCANVRRAARAITQFYDKVLAPSGLSASQIHPLKQIKNVGSVNMSDLAKVMKLDRTTLARNLKPLIAAGFISVVAGNDLRTRQVSITSNGIKALEAADPLWAKAQEELHEYMGTEDLQMLIKLLSRIEALVP